MFRAHVLIIRRSKLHYTASEVLFHASTCFEHMCSSSGGQNYITQPLKFYFMPLHVSSTCAHHQEVKIALHSLWYHHTYRCDDTMYRHEIKLIVKQVSCIKVVKY